MIYIEQHQCLECGSYYGREYDPDADMMGYNTCPFCDSDRTVYIHMILPFEVPQNTGHWDGLSLYEHQKTDRRCNNEP